MSKIIFLSIFIMFLCFVNYSSGAELFSITQQIKTLCQQGTDHAGSASKTLFKDRNFNFTQEEWDGIQRVLKKDQLYDNKDYRNCVETIAKLFVARYRTQETEQLTGTEQELSEMQECRKNKSIRDEVRLRY